ncbi:hypothetical protein Tco_0677775 [Tanacetum coccineum]|uniref:Uncharacterized protein n=1 Tax=Tanacetum coccineum TaxID=301880 RepID=A0ABQ4XEH7_9ASTR
MYEEAGVWIMKRFTEELESTKVKAKLKKLVNEKVLKQHLNRNDLLLWGDLRIMFESRKMDENSGRSRRVELRAGYSMEITVGVLVLNRKDGFAQQIDGLESKIGSEKERSLQLKSWLVQDQTVSEGKLKENQGCRVDTDQVHQNEYLKNRSVWIHPPGLQDIYTKET